MCGICGYMHFDRSKLASEDILRNMMHTLLPRGPDEEGVYLKDNIALGHRRLSIIDLKTGRQPIFNEDGSIAIVYNGEVYNFLELKEDLVKRNHAFKTNSDTEVVVHAYEEYGEDCLNRFNGMFAFAIWDSRKRTLFLARDQFGKKPVYYASFDNQFIFGSELKAVLKHPSVKRQIDINALSRYLAYEYVPSPHSIFKNIYKLEAGSKISVGGSGTRIERYWDAAFEDPGNFKLKDAEDRLLELFKKAVRERLISDVPLGVFLSGGIDSSSVVSQMAELMEPKDIKTFSIGFKEESYDESGDARRVAEYFGTDHHEEMLDPAAMLEVFPKIVDLLDEPFADSSIIPTYLVSKFTRQHVTVALGGDGGDELFLGYPSFWAHKIGDVLDPILSSSKRLLLKAISILTPPSRSYFSLHARAKRFLKASSFPESVRHQVWIGSFIPEEQRRLFLPNAELDLDIFNVYDSTYRFFQNVKDRDSLDRAMYIYIKTYMTDDILTKVDRASMANSLEVRAPFLDMEFARFALNIPPCFKLKNFVSKWILKDALKGKLPDATLKKPKKGFAVPVVQWLKKDLKNLLVETFDKKKIEREGIFDYAYIKDILKQFEADRKDMRKEIWALFMFEMWHDRWM